MSNLILRTMIFLVMRGEEKYNLTPSRECDEPTCGRPLLPSWMRRVLP